jgi:hypothetical protein
MTRSLPCLFAAFIVACANSDSQAPDLALTGSTVTEKGGPPVSDCSYNSKQGCDDDTDTRGLAGTWTAEYIDLGEDSRDVTLQLTISGDQSPYEAEVALFLHSYYPPDTDTCCLYEEEENAQPMQVVETGSGGINITGKLDLDENVTFELRADYDGAVIQGEVSFRGSGTAQLFSTGGQSLSVIRGDMTLLR